MVTGKALDGKPYAGNPHVRFDEGDVALAVTSSRGSLLYKENCTFKNLKRAIVSLAVFSLLPFAVEAAEAMPIGVVDPGDATAYLANGTQIFKGDLVKQGTGTNALSQADIHTGKGRVIVADGSLAVSGATAANAPGQPLSVLANAVIWLDASLPGTIDFVEDSGTNVSQWRDVRETGAGTAGSPFLYPRAVAFTNLSHSATFAPDPNGWFPVYVASAGGENAYVDFGQYSSGRMVDFKAPDGSAKVISPLRHAFVVLGTHDGHYGFIFNPGSGSATFVPKDYTTLTSCVLPSAFIQPSGGWSTLLSGLFRVDGVVVDPVKEARPNGGWQLLDIKPGRDGWSVNGLFSHDHIAESTAGYGFRQGGGRLCEAILFDKPLEEADRLKVEAYLRHKWFGTKVSEPTFAVGESGSMSLASGKLNDMPDPVELSVGGGAAYNATTGGVERTAAAAGSLVKTGDGELVVGSVSADAERIDVHCGILRIRQGVSAPVSIPANLKGYIEDPSFEAFADKTIPDVGYALSSAEHGWASYGAYDQAYVAKWDSAGGLFNLAGKTFPDGNHVGVLHVRGGLQTTVTLPADGIYRLSYWLAVRNGNAGAYTGHEHLVLVDGIPVAEVKAWDNSYSWHLCSFRLPWLAAGDHTLVLASDLNNSSASRTVDFNVTDSIMKQWSMEQAGWVTITGNIVGLVDDFNVDWVDSGAGHVAVSNASFEVTSFSARGYETNPADLGGWEYVSADSSNRVELEQTWNGRQRIHPASDGCRILNLCNLVQIGQMLTFPKAGTYTLTCAAATASTTGDQFAMSKGTLRFTLGGTEIGTLVPDEVMKTYAITFDVPTDGYSAQLVVAGQVSGSVVSLDDIRVLGAGDAVVDRDTFASSGWSKQETPSAIDQGSGGVVWLPSENADEQASWGSLAHGFDKSRVGIRNRASIWRTVSFPSAGTYRLSVSSIGRFYYAYAYHLTDPGIITRYNGNVFNAWVAKGGVTNVVGTFGVDDLERFVTHRFLFELPEGGDWEVGFSGLKESEHKIPGSDAWHSCGGVLDDLVIERVTAKARPKLPKRVEIEVADGAKLALDFLGTSETGPVRYAGRKYVGEISAKTCPAFVTGTGTLLTQPNGMMIFIR